MAANYQRFQPQLYTISEPSALAVLVAEKGGVERIKVIDTLQFQLKDLYKCQHPQILFKQELFEQWFTNKLAGMSLECYGTWVWYEHELELVHVLPEAEFIEVRTNRNKYKITQQEQLTLSHKKVGIVGLSVGQTVALTIAMERSAGEIRLADFDTIDLSNLNRLRCSISDLGENKADICAREIWRIDPYMKLRVFSDGLHVDNIDAFFKEGGKLDLLIEECDALDIKVLARHKAKSLQVPVLMETNDRCLVDIERFDLEPNRPLLHGLMGDLDPEKLKGLTPEEKITYLMPMVGLQSLSERMKASMIEVQSSISSWPQLASAVTMGAGVAADLSRKILLNESSVSGRFYVDVDELIPEPVSTAPSTSFHRPAPLTRQEILASISGFRVEPKPDLLTNEHKLQLIEACLHAPSGGNCQPWKFYFHAGHLMVFHDAHHSVSMLDYNHYGSYLSIGAVVENARIFGTAHQLLLHCQYFPNAKDKSLVAVIWFEQNTLGNSNNLSLSQLFARHTNRLFTERKPLDPSHEAALLELFGSNRLAQLHLEKDLTQMQAMAEILTEAEKLLLLNEQGHQDMFERELRWSQEEAITRRDGIDLATLNMSKAEVIALKVAGSRKVMEWVSKFDGGEAFKKGTKKAIAASSALGFISMPFENEEAYLHGGEWMQRLWITANALGLAFQPVTQFSYLYARAKNKGAGLSDKEINTLLELRTNLNELLPKLKDREIVFVFRIAYTDKLPIKALRREINDMVIQG